MKISKVRNSTAPVHFKHSDKALTANSGLIAVIKFLDKLQFNDLVNRNVGHERQLNAQYGLAEAMFLVMTGAIAGAKSLTKCMALWSDGVLRKIAGWSRIPDETTVARIFKELSARHINGLESLNHRLRKKIWVKAYRSGQLQSQALQLHWIDGDSTVKTVYGKQEGAAKGYNPQKKGAPSYHPMLAFSAHTKEILQGWLRAGNSYTSNGVVEFMKQLLANLSPTQRICFRGDSGFFVGELFDYLEAKNNGYLVKVKLSNLNSILIQQKWQAIKGKKGWEGAKFCYKVGTWNKVRTFFAVRKILPAEPSQQGELFESAKNYDYFCYVSSELYMTPWTTHKKYGERATSETWIEEAKSQMGLAHFKTNSFLANAALFQSVILAYNTLRWMAILSGNQQLRRWEPKTIQIFIIRVAGQLLVGGNQLTIKTPSEHLHQKPWNDWIALA